MKSILAGITAIAIEVLSLNGIVYAQSGNIAKGEVIEGFKVIDTRTLDLDNSDLITFEHEKTGAKVLYYKNDDTNAAFDLTFKTPPLDNSGMSHFLEHAVLSGSEKYPSSTIGKRTPMQTYTTNFFGSTSMYNTNFAASSLSEEQLYKLAEYELDGAFNPLFYTDSGIFDREAWHYEMESEDSPLTIGGSVYSEMQSPYAISLQSINNLTKTLFDCSYAMNNYGGDTADISKQTNEDMIEYHSKYYHPSNSAAFLYGDIDYTRFLSLMDDYYSKYDKKEFKEDFDEYTTVPGFKERVYEYPVTGGSDTENKAYVVYAFVCSGANADDMAAFNYAAMVFNNPASQLQKEFKSSFPNSVLSCAISFDAPEPMFLFSAENIDQKDNKVIKEIIDTAIKELSENEIDENITESVISQIRHSAVKSLDTGNIGTSIAPALMRWYASTGDLYYYFDFGEKGYNNSEEIFDKNLIGKVINKYILNDSSSALVTTVPVAGLLEKQQEAQAKELENVKNDMTSEEKNEIIEKTKQYKTNMPVDQELDNKIINELSVVNVENLPNKYKEYNISDETKDGVRYITSESNINDYGKGRIMIDVSDVTAVDLGWLSLFKDIAGKMNTEKYTQAELTLNNSKYAGGALDIITQNDGDEFVPYIIWKYEGFSDDSDKIFDTAFQTLFKNDFSDRKRLKGLIAQLSDSIQTGFSQNAYSYITKYAKASSRLDDAYMNEVLGLNYVEFVSKLNDIMQNNPSYVTEKLNHIQEMLYNKYNARLIYSGSKESIQKNESAAEKFFEQLVSKEKVRADYLNIKVPYENTAFKINAATNYNGVYAPLEVLGLEYSGKADVLMNCINDILTSVLAGNYNVYSMYRTPVDDSFNFCTYRDPQVAGTFDVYSKLGEIMLSMNVNQDTLDNYIIAAYSQNMIPGGDLHDAYWAAADYSDGQTSNTKKQRLNDMKSVTVQDFTEYAEAMKKLSEKGIVYTAGSASTIDENKSLYANIKNPFSYADEESVKIEINGELFKTKTPAQIMNDITMVPMREIFEKFGAEVLWDGETKTVTAKKDGKTIVLEINSSIITVTEENGNVETIETQAPEVIVNDYTLIPFRAVSETLGYDVLWDDASRTVTITG